MVSTVYIDDYSNKHEDEEVIVHISKRDAMLLRQYLGCSSINSVKGTLSSLGREDITYEVDRVLNKIYNKLGDYK